MKNILKWLGVEVMMGGCSDLLMLVLGFLAGGVIVYASFTVGADQRKIGARRVCEGSEQRGWNVDDCRRMVARVLCDEEERDLWTCSAFGTPLICVTKGDRVTLIQEDADVYDYCTNAPSGRMTIPAWAAPERK